MSKSIPVFKNDGSGQFNGSIGNGKVDVPTANPVAPKELEAPAPSVEAIGAQTVAVYERFKENTSETEVVAEAVVSEEVNSPETVEPVNTRARVHDRLPFERYSSFNSTILALTDELFKARPSSLSEEERNALYQQWIEDASVAYGLPTVPEIVWDNMAIKPGYNVESNWLYLNPEKPYILKLLNGFRIAQLALGGASPLPSLTEREYSASEYTYASCQCGALSVERDDNLGDSCSDCNTFVINRTNTDLLPSNVEARNFQRDARAWSESLFYTSRPVLFKRQATEGRLGEHATRYFPVQEDESNS